MSKFRFGTRPVKNLLDLLPEVIIEVVLLLCYAMISLGDKLLITWQDG